MFTFSGRFLCWQVKISGFNKGRMIPWFSQSLAVRRRHHGVRPGGPVPFQGKPWGWLLWPFAIATPFRDWWIDCGAAASVSVPWAKASRLRVGIPAMASALGATIVVVLQGALGAGGPGSSSDPHTAVTPLETQQHSPLHRPLIGPDKMTLCGVQQFRRETTWLCQTSLDGSS